MPCACALSLHSVRCSAQQEVPQRSAAQHSAAHLNSGRMLAVGRVSSAASWSSSFTGRTSVKQSRSGNRHLMLSRIWRWWDKGRGRGRAGRTERSRWDTAGISPRRRRAAHSTHSHTAPASLAPPRPLTHPVLGLHRAPGARHRLQRGLEVVAGRDAPPPLLLQAQVEVAQQPEEGGRERGEIGVVGAAAAVGGSTTAARGTHADVAGHLCDQRQPVAAVAWW